VGKAWAKLVRELRNRKLGKTFLSFQTNGLLRGCDPDYN